jgi:hypothetical protein
VPAARTHFQWVSLHNTTQAGAFINHTDAKCWSITSFADDFAEWPFDLQTEGASAIL